MLGETGIGTYVAYAVICAFVLLVVVVILRTAVMLSLLWLMPLGALLRRVPGLQRLLSSLGGETREPDDRPTTGVAERAPAAGPIVRARSVRPWRRKRGAPPTRDDWRRSSDIMRAFIVSTVLAPAIVVACAPRAPGVPAERGGRGVPLAITGVTVVDVDAGTRRTGTTVVLRDGRIAAIGATGAVQLPADAQVVDGRGKHLIPGLWDAHVHLSFAGPEILPLFVAHGVTSVRDVGSRFDATRAMRARIDTGDLIGPRIHTSGPILEGAAWMEAAYKIAPPESPVWAAGPRIVASKANVQRVVDSLKAAGVDLIKSRNVWGEDFLLLAAATERAGIPLASHNPNRVNMVDAARGGLDSFEHAESVWGDFDTMTVAARERMFAEVARTGALVTPTLMADIGLTVSSDSAIEAVLADSLGRVDPRNRSLPRVMRNGWRRAMEERRKYGAPPAGTWEKITRDVRAMHRAGIAMMAGTDVGGIPRVYPGSSLHEELELLVREGGLTPHEALRTATVNPPRFFRPRRDATADLDPLAVGARADLVLLDADPLTDIASVRRIHAVVVHGRLLDRAALDALVADAERAAQAVR